MSAFLTSLLSAHTVSVVIAGFVLVSSFLTALGVALKSIGDATPGWLGTAISWCGSVVHFLNGIFPSSAPSSSPSA
jgi:hypothetical protein